MKIWSIIIITIIFLQGCCTNREYVKETVQVPPVQIQVPVPIYCLQKSQLQPRSCPLDNYRATTDIIDKEGLVIKHTKCVEQYADKLYTILYNCAKD